MVLIAKVKDRFEKTPQRIITCAGKEFTTREWRAVAEGAESEARLNPYLELREIEESQLQPGRIFVD